LYSSKRSKMRRFAEGVLPRWGASLLMITSMLLIGASQGRAIHAPPDASSWFIDMNRFSGSAHGSMGCEDCHGDMKEGAGLHADGKDAGVLKKEAGRVYDYGRCKTCHRKSYERYLTGAHAKALKKQTEKAKSDGPLKADALRAPTCGDCHSSHYSGSHLSRVETGRLMTGVCGACHPAQKTTYMENYHGRTGVNLGHEASAYCTDCHGAHNCVSLKDRKTAIEACRRCHLKAPERFAEFVIHPTTEGLDKDDNKKRARVALIRAVTTIMAIIAILVVGFFYGHGFVWLLRELHEKLRKRT
jgi:cytochrome c554/c'-like protein